MDTEKLSAAPDTDDSLRVLAIQASERTSMKLIHRSVTDPQEHKRIDLSEKRRNEKDSPWCVMTETVLLSFVRTMRVRQEVSQYVGSQ